MKSVIQKIVEVNDDFIDYKIPDKITRSALRTAPKTVLQRDEKSIEIPRYKCISQTDNELLMKLALYST